MTTPAVSTSELGYASGGLGMLGLDGLHLEQAAELQWPLNLTTYDYMRRRDTTAQAALSAITLPVERTQWRIDGRGCDPLVAAHVAEDFGLPLLGEAPTNPGRTKGRFSWHEHLRIALDMLVFGFMPFEQVYRYDEQGRVRLRKLAPRPPRTVSGIDVAQDGGLEAIRQWSPAGVGRRTETRIPVDRLVVYTYRRDPGSWWGNSVLRPAYKHVLTKDPVLRVWAQLIERTGMGVVTYTGPENPVDPDADLAEGLKMAQALRAGSQAGAAVPYGAQLALQGLQGAIPDARAFMQYADDKILESVLANFLKLDGKGGSYALASVQEATFTQSLQALAQQIADTATQHVIEDLVDRAFGPGTAAPRLVFDEIGSRINLTLEGLVGLTQGERPLLFPDREIEQHLRARLGLPLKGATAPDPTVTDEARALAARAQVTQEAREHELTLERLRADALRDAAREQASAQRAVADATVRAAEAAAARPAAEVIVQPAAPAAVHVAVEPTPVRNLIDVQPAPPAAGPTRVVKTMERDGNGDIVRVIEES